MREISVRQWQERFRAGDFSSRDRSVQCEAGWYDWFCRDEALAGRLKKLSGVVLGSQTPLFWTTIMSGLRITAPYTGLCMTTSGLSRCPGNATGNIL